MTLKTLVPITLVYGAMNIIVIVICCSGNNVTVLAVKRYIQSLAYSCVQLHKLTTLCHECLVRAYVGLLSPSALTLNLLMFMGVNVELYGTSVDHSLYYPPCRLYT